MTPLAVLILLSLAPVLQPSAGRLPPVGYVDLGALLDTSRQAGRAAGLRAEAARLRAAAAAVEPPQVPPPPAADPPGSELRMERVGLAQTEESDELELELLRRAMLDQMMRTRQREMSLRSDVLHRGLVDYQHRAIDDQRAWERAVALLQRYERINLQVELAQPSLAATEKDRLQRRLNAIDALTDAVSGARRQEIQRGQTRFARQQVVEFQQRLETQLEVAQREIDIQIARRELELAQEGQRRERYRLKLLEELGRLDVELALDGWRQRLRERVARASDRQAALREAFRTTAAELEAEAARVEREQPADSRPRALAWLRVIERELRVDLRLRPETGVPDVTAEVAHLIDEWEQDFAALAPLELVPWP